MMMMMKVLVVLVVVEVEEMVKVKVEVKMNSKQDAVKVVARWPVGPISLKTRLEIQVEQRQSLNLPPVAARRPEKLQA